MNDPINGTLFFIKRSLSIKCVSWFSLLLFSETYLILRRAERDIIRNVCRPSRKVPFIIVRCRIYSRNSRTFLTKILYLYLVCVIYATKRFHVNKSGYTGNFLNIVLKAWITRVNTVLTKLEFSWHIIEKCSNIRSHESLFRGSRIVPYGWTHRHGES